MEPKLYIPKPCHEDWGNMTPAERGRHCAVCNKVVKDLTALNKIEALQVLSNSGEKEVCGRVNASILDTAPAGWSVITGRAKKWGISVLAFIGFFFIQKKSWAQGLVEYVADTPQEKTKHSTRKFTLYVKVENEDKQPVSYAVVKLKGKDGKSTSGLSDANGNVKLIVEEKEWGNEVDLEITCMGFETYTMDQLHIRKTETSLGVTLKYRIITMPEYIVNSTMDQPFEVTWDYEGRCEGNSGHTTGYMVLGGMGYTVETIDNTGFSSIEEDKNETVERPPYTEPPLKITAFSNPTSGIFTIESNKSNVFDIRVFDNNGKMIMSRVNLTGREQVDLSECASGVYYVKVIDNGNVLDTKKIIVAR